MNETTERKPWLTPEQRKKLIGFGVSLLIGFLSGWGIKPAPLPPGWDQLQEDVKEIKASAVIQAVDAQLKK